MSTTKLTMICPECGAETPSWHQRCDSCGALLHEEQRKLNEGQWQWQWIPIVLFVCVAAGLLFYFMNNSESRNNDESPVVSEEEEEQVTLTIAEQIEALLVDIPKDYYGTVNEQITLEELETSKLVIRIDVIYRLGLDGFADVWISGRVIDRDVLARTLLLAEEGDTREFYIGKNARILHDLKNGGPQRIKFEIIGKRAKVVVFGRLQFGRGDPLYIDRVILIQE